jgi:hypothetical protein
MQGLKTHETPKFLRFWSIVQKEAQENNNVFFLECGEGRDFEDEDMECEDLRGWLIPVSLVPQFQDEWEKDSVSDDWIDYIRWAEWKHVGNEIAVIFQDY